MRCVRLAIVINGTGVGGAERMLARVLTRLSTDEFAVKVFSLDSGGPIAEQLTKAGIPVVALDCVRRQCRSAVLPNVISIANPTRQWHDQT